MGARADEYGVRRLNLLFVLVLATSALVAFSLSGLTGGGAGLLLIPVIGLGVPIAQVPLALTIGTSTSAASRAIMFRRRIRFDVVCWFVPAALPATVAGALLLTRIDPVLIELAIGAFLVANLFMLREKPSAPTDLSPQALIPVGAAAGFLSGLTGAVGLLFNRFYLRIGLTKEEIVATRAANEVALHVVKLVLYVASGLLTWGSLTAGLILAVTAVIASFSLRYVLPFLSEIAFRRISHAAMGFAGMAMVIVAVHTIVDDRGVALSSRVASKAMEATLRWNDGTYSLAYASGKGLRFERAVDCASLPDRVQSSFHRVSADADRVTCEEVRSIAGRSWDISTFRNGRRTVSEI